MSAVDDLLEELARRKIGLELAGTRLRLSPRGAVDGALIGRILACRRELLATLRAPTAMPALPAIPSPLDCGLLYLLANEALSADAIHQRVEWALQQLVRRGEIGASPRGVLRLRIT